MVLTLSGLFREDALLFDPHKPMGAGNSGGGLAVKSLNLEAVLPKIELTSDAEQMGSVCIVEALWFSGDGESIKEQAEKYAAKRDTFKILWTSDFELLRWKGGTATVRIGQHGHRVRQFALHGEHTQGVPRQCGAAD